MFINENICYKITSPVLKNYILNIYIVYDEWKGKIGIWNEYMEEKWSQIGNDMACEDVVGSKGEVLDSVPLTSWFLCPDQTHLLLCCPGHSCLDGQKSNSIAVLQTHPGHSFTEYFPRVESPYCHRIWKMVGLVCFGVFCLFVCFLAILPIKAENKGSFNKKKRREWILARWAASWDTCCFKILTRVLSELALPWHSNCYCV